MEGAGDSDAVEVEDEDVVEEEGEDGDAEAVVVEDEDDAVIIGDAAEGVVEEGDLLVDHGKAMKTVMR